MSSRKEESKETEKKSIVKKVGLIIILIAIICAVVFVGINASKGKKEVKINTNSTTVEKVTQGNEDESTNTIVDETTSKETIIATETKLKDGIEYAVTAEKIKPDIILKDNYFDTQILDFNTNFEQYEGKTVQIEGLYFENGAYTFVGRYSTSNVCPYCPTGYSYFEYEWYGDKKPELVDSESWIKIVGTLKKGNDGAEYYYIDAKTIELMNEKGQDTVSN